ncbi:MAG TPA: glycosyltransferase family 39 protein [Candidatus Nanopelagicales bacterium]|nr:glycosyltransferase family 39 protein [Candidatus Nanopelagicales bacterium]
MTTVHPDASTSPYASADTAFVPPLTDVAPATVDQQLPPLPPMGGTDPGGAPTAPAAPRSRFGRLWRGQEDDPAWVRPSLLALLLATGVLYLWGLSASGWANAFYSAAVQAGTESWKALLFGSSDAANFITVDKPPASLWPMEISARVFGLSSWSILVPQALMGVASVGFLYLAVRRVAGASAGLVAGAVLALTPVATLMFRFNNPDALLVLLLTAAAYATVRATDSASRKWIVITGVLVGFAFLTKSLQAFLPLPAFALVYLVAAPTSLRRRLVDLVLAGVAMVASFGWWIALVELWPASSRPYIGGSQTNSVIELILGYNGLGRITGNETGSVTPGGNGGAGAWGATGWDRLFNASYGGQIAWLIPAALVLGAAVLVVTWRAPRTDRLRASAILWLGWLLLTGLTISFAQGIIHEYYTVALAPAIGALVALGGVTLWRMREHAAARITLGLTVAGTSVWAAVLLSRSAEWYPWLRYVVLALGVVSALAILLADRLSRRLAAGVAVAALVSALLAPAAYSLQTASTAHSGSLPTAGPSTGGFGGRGGPGGGMPPGGPGGRTGLAGTGNGALPSFGQNGTGTTQKGMPPGGPGGGGMGGLLGTSAVSAAMVSLLTQDADQYTWVAAAVGAQTAAGYQLATGDPVMSLGGFNGSDPWPTLDVFKDYVASGQVHWFIAGGGFGGSNGGSSATSEISQWVSESFTAQTVDGVTVYDLTAPVSSASSASTGSTTA